MTAAGLILLAYAAVFATLAVSPPSGATSPNICGPSGKLHPRPTQGLDTDDLLAGKHEGAALLGVST